MKVEEFFVDSDTTIRETMRRIDRAARGIALVVDRRHGLRDTVTDGDIRRAILEGSSLDDSIESLLRRRPTDGRRGPLTGRIGESCRNHVLAMEQAGVRHLPLLDDRGRVVGLACLDDLARPLDGLDVQAVIMAGGFGSRLRPLTDDTPKPMLPVAGRPLMERTIQRLREAGIRRINVTTHYMPEKITGHFGSGSRFGVQLNYVEEHQPLGTAGSLGLVGRTEEPLLVMNGDILTRVDYRAMLEFHRSRQADMTVCVRQYDVKVPYGVIEAEGGNVVALREKPTCGFLVNAGIYLLEPKVRDLIPEGRRFDMTDLIDLLLESGCRVVSFPVVEYWLDIGHPEDFRQAQTDLADMRWAS